MPLIVVLCAALQAPLTYSSPPSGDTAGYWQQAIHYRIVARVDEQRNVLSATARLTYVNNSPDTLRELFVHQHLNAFRPGSKWSAVDEREGRERFQHLADPNFAYERFTQPARMFYSRRGAQPDVARDEGLTVAAAYPGAPDSTVARFLLPRPLPPADTLVVDFAWDARLSTLPRRQGRRGRHYDFAQWFPKVAVYDRGGWEPHALVPAGEFYGEFGTYDVTLVVRDDQVIGATGMPVEGDAGWQRALRWGTVIDGTQAYADAPPVPNVDVPAGFKRVRFVAENVHSFAWSMSPDYRYEGGAYVRAAPARAMRFPVWDTIAVHVLYQPGDDGSWGGGKAVQRTQRALAWLESVYGPYAYPQMTNLHRVEPGGTEFPMMMMDGAPDQDLILHEGGHNFTMGILANNEWRSGWMDEGLTSYQTSWAERATPQDRRGKPIPPARPGSYRDHAITPVAEEPIRIDQYHSELTGRTQPIGTRADLFSEFAVYNDMIYTRAELMYGALRDAIGEGPFAQFLRDYYDRWALRHVDERAMRAAAERASGRDLGWFFDQWVHHTGIIDYSLGPVSTRKIGDGWETIVRVDKQGDYWHPMPVGALVDTGWVLVRADALQAVQTVTIRTAIRPRDVRLDPLHTTEDWYRPNDSRRHWFARDVANTEYVIDWPLLAQSRFDRNVAAVTPLAWYSDPGGVALGARVRTNYHGWADRVEIGASLYTRGDYPRNSLGQVGRWLVVNHAKVPWNARPIVGSRVGAWDLDGITKVQLARSISWSPVWFDQLLRATWAVAVTGTYPDANGLADEFRWSGHGVTDVTAGLSVRRATVSPTMVRISVGEGYETGGGETGQDAHAFARIELEASKLYRPSAASPNATFARMYLGYAPAAPDERGIYASTQTPTETFSNDLLRPRGSPFSEMKGAYRALGGAGLRGYSQTVVLGRVAAVNVEQSRRLQIFTVAGRGIALYANVFGDVAARGGSVDRAGDRWLADAGVGLSVKGALFDREVHFRIDAPAYVKDAPSHIAISFADFW
jgi:hypothetical protein